MFKKTVPEKTSGFTPGEKESFTKLLDKGFIDTFRHLNPQRVFTYTYYNIIIINHY